MSAHAHSSAKTQTPVHIRWMIRRDMPEVLDIENGSFEFPWSEEDFIRCLRQRNCIGMVAEHDERVVGFMIYELHKNRLHILNFAVHEQLRRRGVGSADGRQAGRQALAPAPQPDHAGSARDEPGRPAVLPRPRASGRCRVLRDFYEDTTEDAYLMQYRYSAKNANLAGDEVPSRMAG